MTATLATLTAISTVIAASMTFIVLRLVSRDRRRSAARVAALEADIYRTDDEEIVVLHDPTPPGPDAAQRSDSAPSFSTPARRRAALVAPLLIFAVALVLGIAVARSRYQLASDEPRQTVAAGANQALELLSLDHERDDDRLTVRGVVRNPPRGSEMDHLTAVVLLFNQQGGFITSARSPVESATLPPGSETKFSISVPGASDVGRYRVSFRTDDRVVPHVDRRW